MYIERVYGRKLVNKFLKYGFFGWYVYEIKVVMAKCYFEQIFQQASES